MKNLTPIILILLSIGAYYMYISPTYSEIGTLKAKKESYEDILLKAKNIALKRDEIIKNYNSLSEADLDKLKNIIPEKFDNVLITNHINSIASKYGMVVNDVKMTDEKSENRNDVLATETLPYQTHNMSFTLEGKYENFLAFLKDLEVNFRVIDITSLSIMEDTEDAKLQNLQYSIDFKTYSVN